MSGQDRMRLDDEVTRLTEVAAAIEGAGAAPGELDDLVQEAVAISETVARLLPAALEDEEGHGGS